MSVNEKKWLVMHVHVQMRCRMETALAVSLTCTVWLHDGPLTSQLTASTMLCCYKKRTHPAPSNSRADSLLPKCQPSHTLQPHNHPCVQQQHLTAAAGCARSQSWTAAAGCQKKMSVAAAACQAPAMLPAACCHLTHPLPLLLLLLLPLLPVRGWP